MTDIGSNVQSVQTDPYYEDVTKDDYPGVVRESANGEGRGGTELHTTFSIGRSFLLVYRGKYLSFKVDRIKI